MPVEGWTATTITMDGREMLAFGGCNYLGLSNHPDVLRVVREQFDRYGLSTTASRETTGNTVSHEALEAALARFFGMEAAILTPEGYTANIALGQALAEAHTVALIDEKSHRSVVHMAKAAGLRVELFRHLDCGHLRTLLRAHSGPGVCILTDGVFAADGAVAPLDAMVPLAQDAGATLVVDDCHGFCTLGASGRGALQHFGITPWPGLVVTTTLAKGLGCYGGTVVGTRAMVDTVRRAGGVYRGTTPVPPAIAEGAREALAIIDREPTLVPNLQRNVLHARRVLRHMAPAESSPPVPIMTFVPGDERAMEMLEVRLRAEGIMIPLIDYPGGPAPRYFRMTLSARHTPEMIQRVDRILWGLLEQEAGAPELPRGV
jgi:8-amino-7-oxononanoate synthase